jgi:GcrA cell cycle regulator
VDAVSPLAREPPRQGTPCKVLHVEASKVTIEFRKTLDAIGVTQHHAARLFNVSPRHIRRWRSGDRRLPHAVGIVCNLLATGAVTVEQVEAAALVSTRTNGGAEPEPPAPVLVEPASAATTLVRTGAATFADPGLTTAEKVLALAPGTCRWPCGDPRHPDFFFCAASAVAEPYCEHHRTVAYLAARTGGGHGVRGGLVAHGPQPAPAHGSPSTPSAFFATGTSRPPISRAAFPVAHSRPLNREASPC